MNKNTIVKDERYLAVENASFRLAYMILSYGVLLLISIRSLVSDQTNWEFFALVVISSLAGTLYQLKNKTISFSDFSFSWKWVALFLGTLVFAMVLVLLIALLKS